MSYCVLNYGREKDNDDMCFYHEMIKNDESFLSDIQQVFRSNWKIFLNQCESNEFSTYEWVEFSKEDFVKLGYKLVNQNTIRVTTNNDNDSDGFLLEYDSVFKVDEKSNLTLFRLLLVDDLGTDNYSCFLIDDKKTIEEFKIETLAYTQLMKTNPLVTPCWYLYKFEEFMFFNGYKKEEPLCYGITCSPRKNTLPNEWRDILGDEIFSEISSTIEPLNTNSVIGKSIINIEDTGGEDLPF